MDLSNCSKIISGRTIPSSENLSDEQPLYRPTIMQMAQNVRQPASSPFQSKVAEFKSELSHAVATKSQEH